ncbi:hypothetical protein CHRY9390_03012 [Chryseobacterium aquaeductus]|uniref:Bulb-type lectin domain-containing protein n=1 Tax=Chryseobacterium aquaeductus TaxID=2675056 RepID=A0A9N8QT70_9FLAO|nr:bulb-type lectin domain-containing protein [Chryseobacterium aquaeductus]CAA7332290.1 hypothetical protein CHRY9390_03012 [Chryseobacterium potabilaquae]CAD7815659.1 hypothetical protein CHRY9390_03012 [Chryseobacterium aquaeductus]
MRKYLLIFLMLFSGLFLAQNIYNGQNIEQNRKYWSGNNRYYLIFQGDGNLVVYNKNNDPMWSSNTSGRATRAVFQDDGNLVVYGQRESVVYSTKTNGKRADRLTMQDDGNLVIYTRSNPLWSSNTNAGNGGNFGFRDTSSLNPGYQFRKGQKLYSANRSYYLSFQTDGNLVLATKNGDPIWSSATDNRGYAKFQDDGNLVVYDSYNKAIWSTNSSNRGVRNLKIQDDGNLVLYNDNNSAIWSSGTQR